MKNLYISLWLFTLCNLCFGQEDINYLNFEYEFEVGKSYKLFGDNVKLRNKPSSESEVLDTLDIASDIEILKKTKETLLFNGQESHWYKVKADNKVGYILGGLISLDYAIVGNDTYLISTRQDTIFSYLKIRLLAPEATNYFESEISLFTYLFSIQAFDGRGLAGVTSMLFVDIHAEACGVDGGGTYLFHEGTFFEPVIKLSVVGDAGVFHFSEELVFPDEDEYSDGSLLYIREASEYMDENLEWEQAVVNRLKLRWVDRKITPNPDEILDDE